MSQPPAFHPERVPGDPAALRWVFPQGVPASVGTAVHRLVDEGVLQEGVIEYGAVLTRLADQHSWGALGARVRAELAGAAVPATPAELADGVHDDDALRTAVQAVLDGPAGSYVASHGGQAELVDAHDGRVTLRLGGACSHCPAAGATLDTMLETQIRARYPALVEVRRAPGRTTRTRLLSVIPHRRITH